MNNYVYIRFGMVNSLNSYIGRKHEVCWGSGILTLKKFIVFNLIFICICITEIFNPVFDTDYILK